jgi:hypothetical protein
VNWLEMIRTFWPVLAATAGLVLTLMPLWLRTMFPTKVDLVAMEKRIEAKIDAHEERLREGSRKLADLDKRMAVVEEECDSQPTKNDLNSGLAKLSGRMSGVESGLRGVERLMNTHHDYLRAVVERGLNGGGQ